VTRLLKQPTFGSGIELQITSLTNSLLTQSTSSVRRLTLWWWYLGPKKLRPQERQRQKAGQLGQESCKQVGKTLGDQGTRGLSAW